MELVYLWVEDYKNIHKQGFNFSPRFECKFHDEYEFGENGKEKLKDDCKLEINLQEHIENFFGDNINITVIVGKNGSGKSSIVKLLHKELLLWKAKGFAIFINKKNEIFYLSDSEKYPFLRDYKQLSSSDKKTGFPFFEYSFTFDRDLDYTSKFIYPKKEINRVKGVISLGRELLHNQKNILFNYFDLRNKKQLNKFKSFFMPKTINIFFDTTSIKSSENFPKLTTDVENKLSKRKDSITKHKSTSEFIEILKSINKLLTDSNSYENRANTFDYVNHKSEFKLGSSDTSQEGNFNIWDDSFKTADNFCDINTFSEIKNIQYVPRNEQWIDESDILMYSFDIDKLSLYVIKVILTSFSSYQFTIQLCDINHRALNDLSFGEQQQLFILNQLYSLGTHNQSIYGEGLNTPSIEEELKFIEHYVVLLDEIDISFHPDWQKQTIQYIIDFLSLIHDKQFHLIFTTHSPFLLSNIPKQNIIFLDTYKEKDIEVKNGNQKVGNCKVVDGLKEKKQTFGANIHTLLSDSFFMEDGLMGEFAKGKIEEVIKLLNQSRKLSKEKKKYCQDIISIIGEPVLQNTLQSMLDEKAYCDEDELTRLKREQKEIEVKIEDIERNKDEEN